MTEFPTRRATPTDVPAIFSVRTSVLHNHLSESELAQRGITQHSLAQSLRNGTAKAWCTQVDHDLVGFSLVDPETRHVSALFVLPSYEGRGIGSNLLKQAIQWLGAVNQQPIWLYADPSTPSMLFYEKRGWQQTNAPSTSTGDVLMKLEVIQ